MYKKAVEMLISVVLVTMAGCGGGTGSTASTGNPLVASQVADLKPENSQDTVSVFVQLEPSSNIVSAAVIMPDNARQIQEQFLLDLQTSAKRQALQAANTGETCSVADLSQRIAEANRPSVGVAVRVNLSGCELDLLPKIANVQGVHADIPLESFGTVSASAGTLSSLNTAVLNSYNDVVAWPTVGAQTADGSGRVIAVLDSGVDGSHPALGPGKVLQGACFSTPGNGGSSFCPNGGNSDTTSPNAARSCLDGWGDSSNAGRSQALQAGCGHGTSMAAAAAMNYAQSSVTAGGVARQAMVLPVQVFNKTRTPTGGYSISSSSGDLLAALEWVTQEAGRRKNTSAPLTVVNMSLGGGSYTGACDSDYVAGLFKKSFDQLRALGVLPVVAAGNSGTRNAVAFPACVSNAFAVAATQLGGAAIASYSNFSSQVKMFSIGGDTNGQYALPTLCAATGDSNCWATMAGTSPATALVSGAVAVLSELKPGATAAEFESALATAAAGGSAKSLTVNGLTRPRLRVTAASYALLGQAESTSSGAGGSVSPTPPTVSPPPVSVVPAAPSYAQICFYPDVQYRGIPSCVLRIYQDPTDVDPSRDLYYRYSGRMGSVSIRTYDPIGLVRPVPLTNGEVEVTLYTSARSTTGRTISSDVANVGSLFGTSRVNIQMIRIYVPPSAAYP